MIGAFSYDWIPGIITAIFSGGAVGSIVALVKVRPEAGQIVVTAAQGALLVQTGVIENLQKEIIRLNEEITGLKNDNESLRAQVAALLQNQVRHDTEIKGLTKNGSQH